jgi:lipopolysaccharide biosynthesis protein
MNFLKAALIPHLHKALQLSNHDEALRLCTEILNQNDYPLATRNYVQNIKYCLASGSKVYSKNVEIKRLVYGAFYESFENRYINDTYVKAIAFYLPQFHCIPENDLWWGRNFTEWTNTRKSLSRFNGHYQPRIPHQSIGYYDLSLVETLENQAKLAEKANIDAFCFYYYWFSGKKLLDTPIENLLNNPHIGIEFVICWANENWTRRWDGLDHQILIGQDYHPGWETEFIQDVARFFADSRYLRLNGKPVIIIYKLLDIPDPASVLLSWRQWCHDHGIGEISIWAVYDVAFQNIDLPFIDRFVEFPPRQVGALEKIDGQTLDPLVSDFHLYDYKALVESITRGLSIADSLDYPIFRTAMMGWDNSARRNEGFSVWVNYSTQDFYSWCRHIWQYTIENHPPNERFMFFNAWNEWAEGTYLEPDERFGFANINTLSRAIAQLPLEARTNIVSTKTINFEQNHQERHSSETSFAIAVHIHLHYIDSSDQLYAYLSNIHTAYDIYITITNPCSEGLVRTIFSNLPWVDKLKIIVVPNVGRDIGPFIIELADVIDNYDLVLHIHGKRSESVWWGHLWREYLLEHCLGSPEFVNHILNQFKDHSHLGLLSPPAYPPLKAHMTWGGDAQQEWCQQFLDQVIGQHSAISPLPSSPHFPAGSFFWARVDAVNPLFKMKLTYDHFAEERFEIDYRLEHVIERLWPYVGGSHSYSYQTCLKFNTLALPKPNKKRLCLYASYSSDCIISDEALYYIKTLSDFADTLVIVSNSPIDDDQFMLVNSLCSRLIVRDNSGFDFGAWRDAIVAIGYDQIDEYDELILANSSCLGPFLTWDNIFASMESDKCDFWGLSIFPEVVNSDRPEAQLLPNQTIPRHVQSFFTVFSNQVVRSSAFQSFWSSLSDEYDLLNAVVFCETQLTKLLESHGFSYSAYCKGHEVMQSHNNSINYNAIYNQPYELLLLGSPVIKNKFKAMWPGQLQQVKEFIACTNCYPLDLSSSWH